MYTVASHSLQKLCELVCRSLLTWSRGSLRRPVLLVDIIHVFHIRRTGRTHALYVGCRKLQSYHFWSSIIWRSLDQDG